MPILAGAAASKLTRKAGEKLAAEKYDEAAALYAEGERLDPANSRWTAAARTFCGGPETRLAQALTHFAELEPNDLPSREKLAALSLELGDAAAARRLGHAALGIQVERPPPIACSAASLMKLQELDRAIVEYEVAVEIDPNDLSQRFDLADALLKSHKPAEAKKVLQELLRRDPKYPAAAALLESIEKMP